MTCATVAFLSKLLYRSIRALLIGVIWRISEIIAILNGKKGFFFVDQHKLPLRFWDNGKLSGEKFHVQKVGRPIRHFFPIAKNSLQR